MSEQAHETGEPDKRIDEAEEADVKYIYLDIVGFTRKRSVEAQSFIIAQLNQAVKDSLKGMSEQGQEIILIPTGDGMAIAFLNFHSNDIHLRTALLIIETITKQNEGAPDQTRKFAVRIGLNENRDNVILDINGNRNVAGNGIAMAQRIMEKADEMQILAGESVFIRLSPREKYMNSFRRYAATGKHGVTFQVFQYVGTAAGINTTTPSAFQPKVTQPPKYSQLIAYYVAEAAANKKVLLGKNNDDFRDQTATALLFYRAEDHVERVTAQRSEDPLVKTEAKYGTSFEEQYRFYREVPLWVLADFAQSIMEKYFDPFANYFEGVDNVRFDFCIFPNAKGIAKLKVEWPDIAKEFGL